ncbi:MAG: hypothetical protein V1738_01025 [Patescibacteria group bacterium]
MNPETNRENKELYWEKRRLSERIEHDLLGRLESGKETMPDMITCPNESCRYPLTVKFFADWVELSCQNCEYRQIIRKNKCSEPRRQNSD